jgi:hypothetical protein
VARWTRILAVCLGCCTVGIAATPVVALGADVLSAGLGEVSSSGTGAGAEGTRTFPSLESSDSPAPGTESSSAASSGPAASEPSGEAHGSSSDQPPAPAPAKAILLAGSPFPGPPVQSPEQLSADAQSRLAFTGMGREAAVTLAKRSFDIGRQGWLPPGSEAGTHVTRYLSLYTASEERPEGKHVLVQSTVPLQVENGSGKMVPASSTLQDEGNAYVPASPLIPISISKSASSGISLPYGIRVVAGSAAAPEAPALVGNEVVFANTARDTDFMVEPLAGGTGVETPGKRACIYAPGKCLSPDERYGSRRG